MNYADHPLLEGFKDLDNQTLLVCAIAQLDMAAWIKNGAQTGKPGLAKGVSEAIEEGFEGASRENLEKFLYHAILAAVEANNKSKEAQADDSINPENRI
jgi:hypothetical protein